MKAAYYEETGPPDVIQYGELPKPMACTGQALVKMEAVAVNPIDTYIRAGMVPLNLPMPFIPGGDLAGTVEALGAGANRFKPSDRVWCALQGVQGRQGTFAEYVAIDEAWLHPMPTGADAKDMAAMALVSLTAHAGLFERAGLKRGETVFASGGTGGVGSMVIQMAKAAGARVITTAGSKEKAASAKELGADAVILYKDQDFAAAVRKFAPDGINVWYETLREPDLERNIPLLGPRGRMILMAGRAAKPHLPLGSFYTRGCSLLGTAMLIYAPEDLRGAAEEINKWVAEGKLRAHIDRVMKLEQAAEAHRLQEASTIHQSGELHGKIVLVP